MLYLTVYSLRDADHDSFADASDFLQKHPYPGRPLAQTFDPSPRRRKRVTLFSPLRCLCGRAEAEEDDPASDDEDGWGWGGEDGGAVPRGVRREGGQPFKWTEDMMTSFREELEKLVVLDYLIRNTDRGLDNFVRHQPSNIFMALTYTRNQMMKACYCTSADPPPSHVSLAPMSEVQAPSPIASPSITRPNPPGKGHIHLAGAFFNLSTQISKLTPARLKASTTASHSPTYIRSAGERTPTAGSTSQSHALGSPSRGIPVIITSPCLARRRGGLKRQWSFASCSGQHCTLVLFSNERR